MVSGRVCERTQKSMRDESTKGQRFYLSIRRGLTV